MVISTPILLLSLIPTKDWKRCILSWHRVSGACFILETHFALTHKGVGHGERGQGSEGSANYMHQNGGGNKALSLLAMPSERNIEESKY